ncbi:aldehyde dehydrogenase [Microbulbifer sp. A4B17]|uniref:aldehyde dehydrogenase family protein n=1 Tax=Microbulbifer sp. A4B17 TaxID=359370 RepID=UPI000D52ED6F|nr:aldehyde dehydrogenase family protein [Microbulbifer sp. A4B17]AWF83137.1 aldehyde dehydrogenase [Microbulbifer sp. A4B17]
MENILRSIDPLTGKAIGSLPVSKPQDIQDMVEKAHKAQQVWSSKSLQERVQLLQQAYTKLNAEERELAQLISREMGKDARRAQYEAGGVVQGGAWLAGDAGEALRAKRSGGSEIQYRPLGVVAVISPWNYPLAMANNLIVPALVAGNAVILKPSEESPLVADLLVKTLNQTLPQDILQIAHGDGATGEALVKSPINMVAFTGSRTTGQKIMANAAPALKRLVMELGGNDPMIVLQSANIPQAAQFAVGSSFENSGQMCTSTERIYVDEKIADKFENAVVALAKQYRVGGWQEPQVDIGPLVNHRQHQKVVEHIHDALNKGAKLLLGERDPQVPFIPPTVISGIRPGMLVEDDETFGPIVAIDRFSSVDDVIERANNSVYGLGAVVFGESKQAEQVASQLQAGMIGINQGAGGSPWVGAKQSGFGFHGGAEGHRQFAQITVLNR